MNAKPEASSTETLNDHIQSLQDNATRWARLEIRDKISLLEALKKRVDEYAKEWADAAIAAKGIAPNTAGVGEEWISGPWATQANLSQYLYTLQSLDKGQIRQPESLRTRADGQLIAKVFPASLYDHLLLNGVTGEVWMEPGVTEDSLPGTMATFYQQENPTGAVTLVLGAGNISSIAPLDVLYNLFVEGKVCLLKMNPVNDYLGPVFEKIFAPLVKESFLHFAYGGADIGEYLTRHKGIDDIHITGSSRTHDAIVFGGGEEGRKRKAENRPLLNKPISSELGGCCPTIVVPGPWEEADLRYQAEHIVTQKYHNAGFNCVASQVLVLPESWSQSDALMAEVEKTFAEVNYRQPYYPGAEHRISNLLEAHPEAERLDDPDQRLPRTLVRDVPSDRSDEVCFQEEFFGGAYAQTRLPGESALEFLQNAVRFCNDRLFGTLGANLIIHPETIDELGPALEDCIADLRYGGIGINAWSALAYLLPSCSWGAFPGHTLDDIQSGRGVVHNALMFGRPQKSVVYANFYPFPRAITEGQYHLSPRPPWFVTNRKAHTLGPKLARFEARPGLHRIPGIFIDALQG